MARNTGEKHIKVKRWESQRRALFSSPSLSSLLCAGVVVDAVESSRVPAAIRIPPDDFLEIRSAVAWAHETAKDSLSLSLSFSLTVDGLTQRISIYRVVAASCIIIDSADSANLQRTVASKGKWENSSHYINSKMLSHLTHTIFCFL